MDDMIRAALERHPRPWRLQNATEDSNDTGGIFDASNDLVMLTKRDSPNAALIVAAVNGMPALPPKRLPSDPPECPGCTSCAQCRP